MGSVQGPRFQGIKTLGKGAYGFVQLAFDQVYGENVAIKYIPRGENPVFYKYVLREVLYHQQLSLCKHPHIVTFHEVFLTPRYLGVVMEYIDGQDLQAYLVKAGGRLSEDVARFVFQQLVVAVDFIHKKGKVNRDIKLANVLVVESGQLPLVKLCDFGFSKDKFDDSAPQTQIGTALFTAPEVFLNVQGRVYEGEAVDLWSCGVVLHMLLFGRHPFLSEADMALSQADQMVCLIENTVKGSIQLPDSARQTDPACDLLSRILVPSPKQRYGVNDIFEHAWFTAKLPPGALELNNAYLPAMGYQNARQGPDTIKQTIKAAIQVIGPDGQPVPVMGPDGLPTGAPTVSGVNSIDWADSPTDYGQGQVVQQPQEFSHPEYARKDVFSARGATVTSQVPGDGASGSGGPFQQQRQRQPDADAMQRSSGFGDAGQQQWQAATPSSQPAAGWERPDSDLQRIMEMLESSPGMSENPKQAVAAAQLGLLNAAAQDASKNPDPEVEALPQMDMDTSGNVLFDSGLLKGLLGQSGQF